MDLVFVCLVGRWGLREWEGREERDGGGGGMRGEVKKDVGDFL